MSNSHLDENFTPKNCLFLPLKVFTFCYKKYHLKGQKQKAYYKQECWTWYDLFYFKTEAKIIPAKKTPSLRDLPLFFVGNGSSFYSFFKSLMQKMFLYRMKNRGLKNISREEIDIVKEFFYIILDLLRLKGEGFWRQVISYFNMACCIYSSMLLLSDEWWFPELWQQETDPGSTLWFI